MNSKLGTILSILFMLLGITIWSISVLAVEPVAISATSAIASDTPKLEADGRPAIAASNQQSIL